MGTQMPDSALTNFLALPSFSHMFALTYRLRYCIRSRDVTLFRNGSDTWHSTPIAESCRVIYIYYHIYFIIYIILYIIHYIYKYTYLSQGVETIGLLSCPQAQRTGWRRFGLQKIRQGTRSPVIVYYTTWFS